MGPMPAAKRSPQDFDSLAMFEAMDAQRTARGLTWPQVAQELWDQSRLLNQERRDHPISASTLTGIRKRGDSTCQHALFILRWLGRSPESFLPDWPGDDASLPHADERQRLRWNLARIYEALDERRQQRALTWRAAAGEIGCTDHQLTGIRTARYAIGMRLCMRIVQWLERPASEFIDAAMW